MSKDDLESVDLVSVALFLRGIVLYAGELVATFVMSIQNKYEDIVGGNITQPNVQWMFRQLLTLSVPQLPLISLQNFDMYTTPHFTQHGRTISEKLLQILQNDTAANELSQPLKEVILLEFRSQLATQKIIHHSNPGKINII